MLMRNAFFVVAVGVASCGVFNKSSGDDSKPGPNNPPPKDQKTSQPSQSQNTNPQSTTPNGGSTPPSQPNPPSADSQFKSSITGNWKSSCGVNSDGTYSISYLKYDGANLSYTLSTFAVGSSSCTSKYFDLRYSGPYTVGAPSTAKNGGFAVVSKFNAMYLTFYNQVVVDNRNSYAECGYSNWTVGSEQVIPADPSQCFDLTSAQISQFKTGWSQVLVVNGNSLSIFASDSATSPIFTLQKQ